MTTSKNFLTKGSVGFMFLMLIENQDDRSKVERLYYDYRQAMYYEAYFILENKELSEEAVQESFVRIIHNLHKIDESNKARTRAFLVVICGNVARDMRKARYKKENTQDLVADPPSEDVYTDIEGLIITRDTLGHTCRVLKQLNPIYRDVFLLRRVYDFSREDIAAFFGISVETVKKRLTRAKAMILQLVKEGEKNDEE